MILRRLFLSLALLLAIASPAIAQNTLVSATITDTGGQAWVSGTYTFTSEAYPSIAIISGTLDSTGSFTSISFPTNNVTAGVGGRWRARICPAVTAPCYGTSISVPGGSTLSLTSALIPPAITIDALKPPPLTAYTDSEIINSVQGSRYFNVTDNTEHVCKALPCSGNWQAIPNSGSVANFTNGGSMQGTWTAGPTYAITAVTEVGNVVTVTTSTPCSAITAAYQSIVVSGVGVAGYNSGPNGLIGFFTAGACAGSTFTYFNPTSGLGASSGGTVIVSPIFSQGLTHTGPETISGQLTMTNHNQVFWAGPGLTPTIDQAIASCGTNPCMVEVSPMYTGAESVNLFTTSTGYNVYTGPNNVTVRDMRANSSGLGVPLYSIGYGGRWDGELTREFVNYWSASPTDSTASLATANWVSGALPTNTGAMLGSSSVVILHDAVTIGASASVIAAADAETWIDSTSQDIPVADARAYTGQVLINRTNATQSIRNASTYFATNCLNLSSSGAVIVNCYGYDSGNFSTGPVTGRNYAYHSNGNFLFENNSAIDAVDVGAVFTIASSPTGATESGRTVTITTTAPCSLTTNQAVTIAGVGVSGYNGNFFVLSPGCNGGSTFTYTDYGTSALAASGSGTATGGTSRRIVLFRPDNGIDLQPLADTSGFNFKTQGGSSLLRINSNAVQTDIAHVFGFRAQWNETTASGGGAGVDSCYGDSTAHALLCNYNSGGYFKVPLVGITNTWSAAQSFGAGQILPNSAGLAILGTTALPIGTVQIGTAATNNFALTPSATGQATAISMLDPKAATAAVSWQGGIPCTNGELALSAGWGTTATVTAVVGLGWSCEWTLTSSGTGQAASPTITDTLVLPVLSASIACEMRMVGGTGTATLIDQTTLSATAPVFTFGGTPVAASTYKVYRRC